MTNKEFFLATWEREYPVFAECFKSVPDENSAYTPHPKTRSALEIVQHVIGHPLNMIDAIGLGDINYHASDKFSNMQEAAAGFTKNAEILLNKVRSITENDWNTKPCRVFIHGHEIEQMRMPAGMICWTFLFDMIHHRGQLSTYYRPMNAVTPSVYGPTREMNEEMAAMQQK